MRTIPSSDVYSFVFPETRVGYKLRQWAVERGQGVTFGIVFKKNAWEASLLGTLVISYLFAGTTLNSYAQIEQSII